MSDEYVNKICQEFQFIWMTWMCHVNMKNEVEKLTIMESMYAHKILLNGFFFTKKMLEWIDFGFLTIIIEVINWVPWPPCWSRVPTLLRRRAKPGPRRTRCDLCLGFSSRRFRVGCGSVTRGIVCRPIRGRCTFPPVSLPRASDRGGPFLVILRQLTTWP